jgi:transcriptional antiterminator RfaH
MSKGPHWYVVRTQAHNETRAELNLRRQGLHTYLPRYIRTRRHARRTETVVRPLFPRYLFVALDLGRDRWRVVNSTSGVCNVIGTHDEPLAVPDGIVEEIRAREGRDGLITLGLPAGVEPGSRVRLIDGIFADTKGVVERVTDNRRIAILLELLGRNVRVFVPAEAVQAA